MKFEYYYANSRKPFLFNFWFLISILIYILFKLVGGPFEQRNSHWRAPGFVGQHQPMKNGSDSVPTISGNFEENNLGVTLNALGTQQHTLDPESGRDPADKSTGGEETELSKQEVEHVMSGHEQSGGGGGAVSYPLQRLGPDSSQSMECPATGNILTQHEDFTVEGGTINISSVYSQA